MLTTKPCVESDESVLEQVSEMQRSLSTMLNRWKKARISSWFLIGTNMRVRCCLSTDECIAPLLMMRLMLLDLWLRFITCHSKTIFCYDSTVLSTVFGSARSKQKQPSQACDGWGKIYEVQPIGSLESKLQTFQMASTTGMQYYSAKASKAASLHSSSLLAVTEVAVMSLVFCLSESFGPTCDHLQSTIGTWAKQTQWLFPTEEVCVCTFFVMGQSTLGVLLVLIQILFYC